MTDRGNQRGSSYIEVLVAAAIVAVALVPMMDSLHSARTGTSVRESLTTQRYQLTALMETVLAEPFSNLGFAAALAGNATTPTAYSDPPGSPDRRLVYLSLYDADNADADADMFTGTDAGLLWVRIEIEGTAQVAQSLVSQ